MFVSTYAKINILKVANKFARILINGQRECLVNLIFLFIHD